MTTFIGTSGWQYRSWREGFYPTGLAQARWLEHYARHFQVVEVNNAFYRLPEATTFAAWAQRTPPDFIVGVKVSRFLTHVKRLKEPEEPVARFLDRARHLGSKLGPVLLQLPPQLRADADRLDHTLALFPADVRVAVEFRHPSWFTDEVRAVLERRAAAFCLADSPRRETPVWRTTSWGYLRLHEGRGRPHPCYTEKALAEWAERVAGTFGRDDVYVFFNNDPRGCAVRDAVTFADAATRAGLAPTRVPNRNEVKLTAA